jgi:Tfp pilus assembly protein PilV
MNDQASTSTSRLAMAVQDEMEKLDVRCQHLTDQNATLDKALALSEQDCDSWKRRALDAESTRDRYAHFCVELISRSTSLSELATLIAHCVENLVKDAKRIAAKPNGLPVQQVILPAEDQARLQNIARTFGYREPGQGQQEGGDHEADRSADRTGS